MYSDDEPNGVPNDLVLSYLVGNHPATGVDDFEP